MSVEHRNKRRRGQGFSLIELIIAIAILVILTGLLAPQFLKYIERSRRAVCMSAMDTLAGEYAVGLIDLNHSPSSKDAVLVLNEVMKRHKAKEIGTSENSKINEDSKTTEDSLVYLYEGVCKSGGNYRCEFSADLTSVVMECSKHGEWELDIVTLKRALDRLDFSDSKYDKIPYKSLDEYFNETNRIAINSEAVAEQGYEGSYTSFAKAIEDQLKDQGISIEKKTWRLYKKGGTYTLTLAAKKITSENEGEVVQCTRYDINTGIIEHGTVEIVKQNNYPVLNGGSFKLSENK